MSWNVDTPQKPVQALRESANEAAACEQMRRDGCPEIPPADAPKPAQPAERPIAF